MAYYSLVLAVASVLLGVIVGSFLNALLFRFGTGRSIIVGRSCCIHCGHTLSVQDLVPVVSYALLRGRCRYCSSRIPPQYPLVELVAAALSFSIYFEISTPYQFAYWFVVWMTLFFIVLYDLRHTIIPWSFSLFLMALSFLYVLLHLSLPLVIAGPLLAIPLWFLSLISSGRWMGWGDGVLELSVGWLLGLSKGLTALMLSFWVGAVVGLALLFISTRWKGTGPQLTMRSEIPFAPFLILGAAVVYFLHVNFFSSFSSFFF